MIKKISTIILILIAVAIAAIFRSKTPITDFETQAKKIGDLTVIWETSPLFVVHNFLPDDYSEIKTVTITNGSNNPVPVGIRGVISTYPADSAFTDQLHLTISNSVWDNTLTDFFNTPGFIPFGNIPGNTTKTYQFQVHFDPLAKNNYQNNQIIFDLSIGYDIEIPDQCQFIAKKPNVKYIFGTDKKETLTGNNYPSIIFGFGGDDMLNGNNQEDCLIGGEGNDKLHGNNKDDVLIGGPGKDDLFGGNGTDICKQGENNKSCEL